MSANESKVTGPVMPFYVRDFILSTTGWTAEEVGHYVRLLAVQWEQGGLPADLASLKRVSPGLGKSWKKLEEKFPIFDEKTRRNPRLESHRKKAVEFRKKASKAGKKGNERRWNGSGGDHEPDHEPDRDPTVLAIAPESLPNPYISSSPPLRSGEEEPSTTTAHASVRGSGGGQPAPVHGPATPQIEDGWTAGLDLWTGLREAWNAAPWVQRWDGFDFSRGDLLVARLADPDWVRRWPDALARLERCRFFDTPVTLLQFLGPTFVGNVLAGAYDHRRGRNGKPIVESDSLPF